MGRPKKYFNEEDKKAAKASKQKERRAKRSDQICQAERSKDAESHAKRRREQSLEATTRRANAAKLQRERRQHETPEETTARRAKDAECRRQRRQQKTSEETAARQAIDAVVNPMHSLDYFYGHGPYGHTIDKYLKMEVLPADGSNSSEALKMNGEVNGSAEGMEVDEDSADGLSEGSLSGSNRAQDADTNPNSRLGSEIDAKSSHFESEGDGKSNSHIDSDGDGKSQSHYGSEYGVKNENQMDGLDVDGDGESLNSEEEDTLLHSDPEDAQAERTQQGPIDVESEEEGDINEGPDDDDDEDDDDPGERKVSEGVGAGDENSLDEGKSGEKTDGETPPEERNGTNDQTTPNKKKKSIEISLTPRRSSRTVQKPVRFGQEMPDSGGEMDSDVEEMAAVDPLADPLIDKENKRFPRMIGNTTIVVSDAKRLADIAASRAQASQPKKEPTLVIIDTNSILSGRGAVPMQTQGGVTITQAAPSTPKFPPPKPKPPQILPTLTDDMYVVEAPSFIVPYVYEKPPVKKFRKYLKKMLKAVRKQDEENRKRKRGDDSDDDEEGKGGGEEGAKKVKDEATNEETPKVKSDLNTEETPAKVVKEGEKMEVDEADKSENEDKLKSTEVTEKKDEVSSTEKEDNKVAAVKKDVDGDRDVIDEKEGDSKVKEEAEVKTEVKKPEDDSKKEEETDSGDESSEEDERKKIPGSTGSYFDNPLGKFFMQIGMNQVQEFVQTDLLKQQKKKQKMGKGTEETQAAIISLKKNLMLSKENNEPYSMEQTKCEFCSFKTESKLIMAHHLETPHMRNYVYRCNFCPLEVRGPHDILYHMEAEHCVRGRLERAPAFHQCPQCPFEDNQKGKLTRHLLTCAKKFRPEKNLDPPPDWEPPAKIPRLPRKPNTMNMGGNNPLYAQSMGKNVPPHLMPKMPMQGAAPNILRPQRGRPAYPQMPTHPPQRMVPTRPPLPPQLTRANMMYRSPTAQTATPPVILPSNYQISNNQLYQVVGSQGHMVRMAGPGSVGGPTLPTLQRLGTPAPSQQKNPTTVKLLNQPSISITPLPRQAPANPQPGIPPQRAGASPSNSKTTFVICEICDGYIKDLEQLRNHMQWIHKVKIHPKMIYNRPPLNCQKCQFRFFTDQGLERHLLGSHGLVTSSMQDQANRGKDGGRCPVCGRVYQWKLLNHVARDHNMTLKPAHLSYKCTVCTATFGMYKQFESHVYSAHSVVAKRVMDKKNGQAPSTSRTDTASLLKPLKINDEITIIPQPAKKPATQNQRPVPGNFRATPPKARGSDSVQVIDLEDSPNKGENGAESLTAVKERLKRRQSLEIRQVESDGDETDSEGDSGPPKSQEEPPEDDDDDQGSGVESDA